MDVQELLTKMTELAERYKMPPTETEAIYTEFDACPDGFQPCNEDTEDCPSDPGSKTYPAVYTASGDRCFTTDVMTHHEKIKSTDKTKMIAGIRELVNHVAQISQMYTTVKDIKDRNGGEVEEEEEDGGNGSEESFGEEY